MYILNGSKKLFFLIFLVFYAKEKKEVGTRKNGLHWIKKVDDDPNENPIVKPIHLKRRSNVIALQLVESVDQSNNDDTNIKRIKFELSPRDENIKIVIA